MQIWNVLHAARWNTGRKKVAKNRHLGTIAQLCRAISSQLMHVSIIRKRIVKQQYVLYMSSQYGELRPTSGWDRFVSLGHPTKFQLVSRLGSVTARHVVVGVSQTWTDSVKALKQVVVLRIGFNPTRSTSPCYSPTHACNNTVIDKIIHIQKLI